MAEEKQSKKVKFVAPRYKSLKVFVTPDFTAEFVNGSFETEDPRIVKGLKANSRFGLDFTTAEEE
jgi:hypothetical protein